MNSDCPKFLVAAGAAGNFDNMGFEMVFAQSLCFGGALDAFDGVSLWLTNPQL